ncbi:MAG: hypothetical protein AAFO69_14360, partial [Bacteroidota bacterium]
MKRFNLIMMALLFCGVAMANNPEKIDYKKNFVVGTPNVESINAISFGPEGILFIGDSKTASIIAIDTKDTNQQAADKVSVKNIDQKIAEVLGTEASAIDIRDMAVNPVSNNIYLAVHANGNQPLILKLVNEELMAVPLTNVSFSSVSLNAPIAEDAKDRRGRSQRNWA